MLPQSKQPPVVDLLVVLGKTKQLLKGNPEYDQILATARWLHAKFPGANPRNMVEAYLAITRIVAITSRTTMYEHSCTEAGHLVGMLSWLYSGSLPLTDEVWNQLVQKRDDLTERCKACDPADLRESAERQIAASNILRLTAAYQKRIAAHHMIRTQFKASSPMPLDCPDDMSEQADEAAKRLASLRAYGVSSCIMQDGIMHDRAKCWVFYDGYAVMSRFPKRFQAALRIPLALTFLAERDDVRTLDTAVKPTDVNDDLVMFEVGFKYNALIGVQTNGELTLDTEYGLFPLQKAFEEAEKSEYYELFRFVHLMRLCDLLIPETVKRERGIRNWPAVGSSKSRQRHRDEVEVLFREFWVPRRRVIYEGGFTEALDAAVRRSQPLSREDGEVREQLGYFKPLPAGCVASPEACKLALEEKGELPPEGHTYVRTHPHWYRGGSAIPVAKRRPRTTEE